MEEKKMKARKNKKADLESKKGLFFEIGLIASLLAMVLVFDSSWERSETSMLVDGRTIIDDDVVPLIDVPEEPIEVAPKPIISDLINIVDENVDISGIEFKFEPGDDYKDIIYVPKPKVLLPEEEVDETVPEYTIPYGGKSRFNGGDANTFAKWVSERIKYPEDAMENNVEGKVMLSFIIDTNGNLTNVKVLRSVDASLDREAVRVVSSSPKWTAALLKGKPVRAIYNFPVNFRLSK